MPARRWRLVGGRRVDGVSRAVVASFACVSGDGVWRVPAERVRRGRGCIFGHALHNRCVLHRAQRPSNASHRWRRICTRAAHGQQMDLHPEIFASTVAMRAFQATPLRMRYRNASMRLCSDAELQRIELWRWDRRCACRILSRRLKIEARGAGLHTGHTDLTSPRTE